jgi:hypothetical protein
MAKLCHSFEGYKNKQLSNPLVITAFFPKSCLNLLGIANRFLSSIE